MFEKLKDKIEKNNSIVIFGHLNPDGDCYGSEVALKKTIQLNYPHKKVYMVGSGLPDFFDFLGKPDTVNDEIIQNSLAILVDANDFSRSEDKRISLAKEHIKIDHHVENGKFTQGEFVVDEHANSACQLVLEFIQEANWKFDSIIMSALYLGIVTDTGRFQFIEDFPKAFKEATFLCENGANPKEINRILNETKEAQMDLKRYIYTNYQKTAHGVVYLTFKKDILHKYNITANKAAGMINLLANLEGYPIWCTFAENEDGSCHCEFRSNGPAVQPIANSIGGGGHMLASGATIPNMDDKVINDIISRYDALAEQYLKEQH